MDQPPLDPGRSGRDHRRGEAINDIPPDQLAGARLLLAMRENDSAEMWRVLMSTSTLPLLSGVALIALAFGSGLYGEERLDGVLRLIALDADGGELTLPSE
jgi:hypothetical protein